MPKDGIWLRDPETHEPTFVSYEDLDPEVYPQLLTPIGGFCYEADNFVRLPLPQVPFYLKDWLPKQGKMEIYGQAKAGKSFLSMQLARCIASGEDFIGIPTTAGKVLILQFELGEQIFQGRLNSTGKDYESVFVGTSFSMKLDTNAGQKQFLDALVAIKPSVVILDPFYKIFSGDENEAQDVKKITDFIDEAIESFNCSFVIIHHAGKDLSRGGRGSSILEGWVDSYIEIKRVSKETDPQLKVKVTPKLLRHAELPPKPYSLVLGDDFEFQAVEGTLTVVEKVKKFLREKSVSTGGELVTKEIGGRRAVYEALKKLQEHGVVEKSGVSYKWIGGEQEKIA